MMIDHIWTTRRAESRTSNPERLPFLGNFILRREVLVSLVPLIAVIIGVGLVLSLKWTLRKRLQWLRIIGTTWIVVGLFPVSPSVPLADVFRVYGMGYWMMLAGTLMVTVVALFDLAGTDAYPQNPIAAEQ